MRSIVSIVTVTALLVAPMFAFAQGKDDTGPTPEEILVNAPDDAWRPLDLENTLYMNLPAGMVVIELRPDFAPVHIQRIKELVREGFYDGLYFHRVIEGFMAQGGDPKGDGTGGSDKPNLSAEFFRDSSQVDDFVEIGRDRLAPRLGYIDGMPFAAQPEALRTFKTDRHVALWPIHCPGVMSMARSADPNSANSQFFLMIGDSRINLDRRYSAWGWIVDGFEATRRIERGEPPRRPTPMIRVRMGPELPEKDRSSIRVMRTASESFKNYLKATGEIDETGYVREICNIRVPIKLDGVIER